MHLILLLQEIKPHFYSAFKDRKRMTFLSSSSISQVFNQSNMVHNSLTGAFLIQCLIFHEMEKNEKETKNVNESFFPAAW